MASPILVTKLFAPPTRPEFVPRPGLIKRLNNGLRRKLTLISAPAGFGKTTLVSEWIETSRLNIPKENQIKEKFTWLSLDESDNNLTRFLTYMIAALQTIDVNIAKGVLSALQSPQPPPTETTLTSLINEIAAFPSKIILIFDDYHLIETKSVHDALAFLLEHLPAQMHLVIATREDPYLPLARLRVRHQLTELRATDLRFSSAEAAEFLNQVMSLDLSAKDINALETHTEGWIAGLQLASLALQGAISMQGRDDATNFIQSFTGSHRLVLDYLIEEVLEQQPEDIQTFLLQTAILNQLTGSLCDTVCFDCTETHNGQENGQATLELLERGNLFIVPLDGERKWYRYHHLFADLLRQRLHQIHPEQIPTLHSRASEWYEQNGLPSDAIHHALAAQDFERAADLAELAWPDWSGSFQSIEWLGWLKTLPDELVRTRPVLCVAYAWAYLNAGKLEPAEVWLLAAERWLEPKTVRGEQLEDSSVEMVVVDKEQFLTLPASFATARAYHAQAIGDIPNTVKYAQRVLKLLPEEDSQYRGDATALLGLAYWASGDIKAGHRTLSDGLANMAPLDIIIGTFVLADMKMVLGHLHEAINTCEHALGLATEHGEHMPLGTEDVYTEISKLHRERGNLKAAIQDLQISKKLGEQVELPDWQYRWCIAQARLQETLGDLDGALNLLAEAKQRYVRTPLPDVNPIAAMKTRIWVKQGRLAEALNWVREQILSVDDELSYLHEFEHITLVRVHIAQYKTNQINGSIQEAMSLLERLLKAAEEGGRAGSVIEILTLQALGYEAQDDIPRALGSLELALILAEPEGYQQIFVDEGPPMAKLLNQALKREILPNYSRKLLTAFESKVFVDNTQQIGQLIEPLSARELEVLELVAQGLSNRQIGEQLFLALDTVKGYNRKVFGKLGVKNRTQAVKKAISLKILPPQ